MKHYLLSKLSARARSSGGRGWRGWGTCKAPVWDHWWTVQESRIPRHVATLQHGLPILGVPAGVCQAWRVHRAGEGTSQAV